MESGLMRLLNLVEDVKWGVNKYEEMWYKLLCYYYGMTEIYDRTLTDLRSPYDETEAYLTTNEQRRLSNINANKIKKYIYYISDYNKILKEYQLFNSNKNNLSAQGWIDEYERFKSMGEYDKLFDVYDYEIDKEY